MVANDSGLRQTVIQHKILSIFHYVFILPIQLYFIQLRVK